MVQDKKILLVEDNFPMNKESRKKYELKADEFVDSFYRLKKAGKFKSKEEGELYYSRLPVMVEPCLNSLLHENVKELEEGMGYEINLATSVEDAIEKLEKDNYNFVVTDLGLPFGKCKEPSMGGDEKTIYQEKELIKKVQENRGKVKDKLNKLGVWEFFSGTFERLCERPHNFSGHYSGTIISSLAEEKNIKNYIFTNIDHHARSLLGAMLTENIKPEVYPEILKKLDVYNDRGVLPEGINFVKKDNIYVGKKSEKKHFKEVLLDIIGRQA